MSAHDWTPAGRMDDGAQRYRCVACDVRRHWPEVGRSCSTPAPDDAPRRDNAKSLRPITSVIAGAPPNRACAVCAAAYHSKHPGSRYCSQPCAKKAWDAQYAAAQTRIARRPETPGQKATRLVRQRARRTANGGTNRTEGER